MNKDSLKKHMISMEKIDVKDNVEKYQNYLDAQDIDEEATIDDEDLSYRNASDEITDGIDHQIHENKDVMVDIAEIDFGPKSNIEPGALVTIGDKNLVVAAATEPFDFEGKEYLGISVDSPIYPRIAGKKAGDTFVFRAKSYKIAEVS